MMFSVRTPHRPGDTISFRPKGDLYHLFDQSGAPINSGIATPAKTPVTSEA